MYPRWDDFHTLRKRVDPYGMWESLWVRRCLGSVVDQSDNAGKVDYDNAEDEITDNVLDKRIDLGKSWEFYRVQGDLM